MMTKNYRWAGWLLLLALIALPTSGRGQGPLEMEAVAVAGEPFGVGQIQFVTSPSVRLDSASGDPVILHEKNGRLHYPAFSREPVRGLLRSLLNRPQRMTAWFLFRGREPLEISIPELGVGPVLVQPRGEAAGEPPLLIAWWQAYTSKGPLGGLFSGKDATPPNVRDYLTAMLAHRLRLQPAWAEDGPALDDPVGLLLGSEELRIATLRHAFTRGGETLAADQPLPPAIRLPIGEVPEPPADVKIEPLAAHVPAECLYVRFGSFGNFQWCRTYLSDIGGDIRQLVAARGLDYGLNTRLEQQLLLKTTVLSKLFGDLLISDVAFIGHDTFLREGASMGLLFESRNNGLLGANFQQQRQLVLEQNMAAREEQVEIAGRNVSYISTPDGAVRSYYAVDGDYHLFATSRKLIERFFEAGAGTRALAASREFRHARAGYPLARTDSVFLFLSTAFMEHLVGPQYQMEIGRRLAASVELEMLELARLAAKAEGRPESTIDDLVVGGYLPANFSLRCDGSRAVWPDLAVGRAVDSQRGGRSSFKPVSDMVVDQATTREVENYRALAQYIAARVEYVEPWVMAIKRSPHDGGQERVTVDLRISPSGEGIYDFLTQWLKDQPPTPQQIDRVPGNVLAVEALINGRQTFAGLRDCNPLRIFGMEGENPIDRLLLSLASFPTENIVGYVGVASSGGLDFLGDFRFGPTDQQGFARSDGPTWRRQWGPFNVMSFHPRVLEEVVPRLAVVDAPRPAHARVRVAELRTTQLAEGIDSFVARRAKAASMGNVHLLDSLIQQLHVPPAECRDLAERLFAAKLACPVGGKFTLSTPQRPQAERWTWQPPTEPSQPNGANAPVYLTDAINWFRRLEGDAVLEGKTIVAHLELISQPSASTRPVPPAP
jgi:hypothetical protein